MYSKSKTIMSAKQMYQLTLSWVKFNRQRYGRHAELTNSIVVYRKLFTRKLDIVRKKVLFQE